MSRPTPHELFTWALGLTDDMGNGPTVSKAADYWKCSQRVIREVVEDGQGGELPRNCNLSINVARRLGQDICNLPMGGHEIEATRD